MKLWPIVIFALTSIATTPAEKIDFEEVEPFPELEPKTIEGKVALHFKPQLFIKPIRKSCHAPYPAVNAEGDTSKGIKVPFVRCWGSPLGSQIYGRMVEYEGYVAIMYAFYFPKDAILLVRVHDWEYAIVWLDSLSVDAKVLAVSTQDTLTHETYHAPFPGYLDGPNFKLDYTRVYRAQHRLVATAERGTAHNLVMWEDMTEKAREALNKSDFWLTSVPINDDHFQGFVEECFPFKRKAEQ
ncbi:hypothetical protein CCR75_006150 [Bremia lactucae]|uniref:Necrosis inducing protein NPP1 n=1 Tax=Bremia lactucae TaxID=4779 RepID=A0A976FRC1_BRELC|nr:hypothetical protein CCR75_006150 [Bremia lactucae]